MQDYLWGIDLGGTKIEGVILKNDESLTELHRMRVPTEGDMGYEHVINQIDKLINNLKENSGLRPMSIGIGTPGRLDSVQNVIKNSNTVCLNGKPLLSDLVQKFSIDFKIENDANCFALSEARYLLSQNVKAELIFGIILGTGVGGGIVANGKLISGKHGIAGEWGHNYLDESGGECYCGRSGCTETIIAGPSLERYYHGLTSEKIRLPQIVEQYRNGHSASAKTMERLFEYFGKGMAQIINVLDPSHIIIGGGVGNIDEIYEEGVKHVHKYLFNPSLQTQFVKPKFGDSSGVLGAALL